MVDCTPVPVFDEETGYLLLKDGKRVQVICRVKEGTTLLFLWKRSGEEIEIPLTLEELHKLLI